MKKKTIFYLIAGILLVTVIIIYARKSTAPSSYRRTDNPTQTRSFVSPGVADKDCPDFKTQREAQAFFMANGGPDDDPHNLDRDGDGIACESL